MYYKIHEMLANYPSKTKYRWKAITIKVNFQVVQSLKIKDNNNVIQRSFWQVCPEQQMLEYRYEIQMEVTKNYSVRHWC